MRWPRTFTGSVMQLSLWAIGRFRAAQQIGEDILTRRRRTHGDDHPDTLTSASNLAANLHELGEG